jgi:upstream activation factor subunit UAF30
MSSNPVPAKAAKKVAKKESVATPVVETVAPVAPVVEAPAVVAAPTKRATAKRAPKAEAVETKPAPVVVSSTPVEAATVAPVVAVTSLDDDLRAVSTNLTSLRETTSTLLTQIKRLEKRVHREMKEARRRRRRVKTDENGVEVKRAPSIFERPTQVTSELLTFLNRPAGTLMSRSEVTKAVNDYVKSHDLKNKHDIKPDAALKKLLAIGEGEPLTYFNLQRYLNRHYIKAVPVATA